MCLASPTAFPAVLAVFALSAAAAGLIQEQQSCPTLDIDLASVVRARDAIGPATIDVHCPPSPSLIPFGPPHARMDGLVITALVIATIFVYQVLRALSGWLSDHNSALSVASSIPGRTAAVAYGTPPGPRSISPTEQRALSSDGGVTYKSVEPEPQAESLTGHRTSSSSWPESSSSPDASPSIGTISPAQGYGLCNYHRLGLAAAQIEKSRRSIVSPRRTIATALIRPAAGLDDHMVIRPHLSVSYPSILHTIFASYLSENIESTSQNSDDVHPSPQSSISQPVPGHRASLTKSLTGHTIVALSFLIVGLDWSNNNKYFSPLPGVKHDLEWFEMIRSGLEPFITLDALAHVTHETIRSRILEIFENARHGTAVVLYFNGHGERGSFLLYDYRLVDVTTLVGWIVAIRKETRKYLPVTLVFDHCRFESPGQSFIDLGQGIHIIYAAMPGQRSADIKLAGDEGTRIPYSNFLKVCCLVLTEARARSTGFVDDLMLRMNFWMEAMVRMTRTEECSQTGCPVSCPLCSCPNYDSCIHSDTRLRHWHPFAYPRTQNPNGMFSGFEGGVCMTELLELIESTAKPFLDRIQETAERIKSHPAYQAINITERPDNNQFQPASSRVPRGRNASAAQRVQPIPIS